MIDNKTIIAQITPAGKGAVGILRVSGSQTKEVAMQVLGKIPYPRLATYSKFFNVNYEVLDQGLSLWFPAPHSLTGEDVLELQGHGSPLIIDLLIKRILSINNVRMANPGEFSERAFLNGKIDLIQAEAIDDLINAETSLSARASLNSLQGNFSIFIKDIINILTEFRINIESSIDFSEDETNVDINNVINIQFQQLNKKFLELKKIIAEGIVLKEGKKIVIIGPPNAGKSSLLNVLSCRDRAIVTDIPGTTRDLLYEYVNIHGVVCELIDTAGLRDTNNEIEKIGITRAWKEIKKSDHVLFVIDKTTKECMQKKLCDEFLQYALNQNIRVTFILNKNDLVNDKYGIEKIKDLVFIHISARTGQGIDILRKHIIKIEKNNKKESVFIARRRHINQVDLAYNELLDAQKNWLYSENIELLAESLKIMSMYLEEIMGKFTAKDLLNRIFSSFCIGK